MTEFSQRQNLEEVESLKNQLRIARNELSNLRQQLTNLTHRNRKEHEDISKKLENWKCLECRNQQLENVSEASANTFEIKLPSQYIGIIQTHFPEKRGTPRQPGICSDTIAKLSLNNDVFTNPAHALEGLQEYSHMWILFHFHKNDATHQRAKVAPPRLNGLRTGVFATRSPLRPWPIGLSLVKIDRIMENTIYFSGVDMIDQTPVFDIKPYIPQYDNPSLALPHVNSSISNTNTLLLETRLENTNLNDNVAADDSLGENISARVMDGEESNEQSSNISSAINRRRNVDVLENYLSRTSRMGEREAPDGEEEESPRQPVGAENLVNAPSNAISQVRIPSWIDNPPINRLTVVFKDVALAQLTQLGNETEEKKQIIMNVLREDPRSVYLRERIGSHCYVFRIADLNVSCKFNDSAHTVTVFKIFQSSLDESSDYNC